MDADEIGRLIGDLENRVERLRSLYEQYFMGIERLEPLTARKDVDRRLWTLRREQIRNTGLRFKLETTVQRYNTYQQYWQRIVREIEQGTYQRDLGRAAQRFGDNAVTGFARRRQKMFENAVSKKAERDGRRTGSQPLPSETADVDEAPPSSNRLDVTFEDADAASTRIPVPGATAQPASVAPPQVAAARAAPAVPAAPGAYKGASVPPPRPPIGASLGQSVSPPRPSMASSLEQRAPQPPPVPPPEEPLSLSFGSSFPQPLNAPPAARLGAAAVPAAKPAAVTAGNPRAPVASGAKPTPVATPVKPATPVASPAAFRAPAPAASPSNAGAASSPAKLAVREPVLTRQATAAGAPKPTGDPVERTPPARPPAASRPDASPAVLSEDNSLSPIRIRQIYGQFVEAKRKANESTASVTYEKIAANLESAAKELRAKHKARSVDFEVVMKNGKPVLKPVVKG